MSNPFFSIIIPVYRVEDFIDKCVNSVIAQSDTDWELLLVDDGSPDNSPVLCDCWAQKDSRIRVFHKSNGGVSSARNIGLDNIRGSWIMFLDSDDSITSDCLSKCREEIEKYNLDVLQFYMKKIFPDGRVVRHNRSETLVCDKEQYILSGHMSGCAWAGVYKSSSIIINKIRFNEKLHYLEDAFFVCEVLNCSSRIKRISNDFYEYYQNSNGSDKPKDWDYYLDSIEYGAHYKKFYPEFSIMIDGWCTMLAMRYISLAPKHDFCRFVKVWKELEIGADYLKSVNRRDVKFFYVFTKLVGVHCASLLTKFTSKLYYLFAK